MSDIQSDTSGRRPVPASSAVFSVNPDELIPNDAAAQQLHVLPQTLCVWRVEKRGPRWLKIGRRVFYRQADINAWIAAQLCEVASAAA